MIFSNHNPLLLQRLVLLTEMLIPVQLFTALVSDRVLAL